MTFHLKRKKPGEKMKTALKTSDPCLVHEMVAQSISEKKKKGLNMEGDVVIDVEGKKSDSYLIVKNGVENSKEAFRFVKDHF
jgi:hypothetical protein